MEDFEVRTTLCGGWLSFIGDFHIFFWADQAPTMEWQHHPISSHHPNKMVPSHREHTPSESEGTKFRNLQENADFYFDSTSVFIK